MEFKKGNKVRVINLREDEIGEEYPKIGWEGKVESIVSKGELIYVRFNTENSTHNILYLRENIHEYLKKI